MNAMDFYNGRYFFINMNMLKFTGLWPYQNKTAKFFIRDVFSSLILIPGIPQVSAIQLQFILYQKFDVLFEMRHESFISNGVQFMIVNVETWRS